MPSAAGPSKWPPGPEPGTGRGPRAGGLGRGWTARRSNGRPRAARGDVTPGRRGRWETPCRLVSREASEALDLRGRRGGWRRRTRAASLHAGGGLSGTRDRSHPGARYSGLVLRRRRRGSLGPAGVNHPVGAVLHRPEVGPAAAG